MEEENLSLEDSIKRDMAEIAWSELKVRCPTEAIVLVDSSIDLLEVALAVAQDESDKVSAWLSAGRLKNIQEDDTTIWDEKDPKFLGAFIIPFVLLQEIPSTKDVC